MGQSTSDSCVFCGSEDTDQKLEAEVVDTYGGDYSYQEVRRCVKCGKLFLSYSTDADDGRIHNWDRTIDESGLIGYIDKIAENKREK